MRRFILVREHDVSGVSGTGVVAQGIEFDSQAVVLTWLGQWPTITSHSSIESVEAVHGHGGYTKVVWLDTLEDYINRLVDATRKFGPIRLGGPVAGPGNTASNPKGKTGQIPGQLTFDLGDTA